MSGTALAIILISAFLHTAWNFLLKKSTNKIVFTWCFLAASLLMYGPLCYIYWPTSPIPSMGWFCILGTGCCHFLYFRFVAASYKYGDFTLVYPVQRGSGPLLIPIIAVMAMGEELSMTGASGISLVIAGIYIIHLRSFSLLSLLEPFAALRGKSTMFALGAGAVNAVASAIDKVGVANMFPLAYFYTFISLAWVLLSFHVLASHSNDICREWALNWIPILAVGFLYILTYLLILFVLQFSKVSYVSAVREVSIVLSAIVGILLLGEKKAPQKFTGALLICLGVILISLSR